MAVLKNMWNAINSFTWDQGKEYYAMTAKECISLIKSTKYKIDITDKAFKYGFIKGMRYQKAQEKKKRKAVKK